ncbi:MAG: NADH-quinone oxidoreductase subunit C [Thermoplasmatota archaeon]
MTLPDSGAVEDYTEEEMTQLLAADKTTLSKLQKAAIARFNFKKGKNEAINFRAPGSPPPAAAASAAPDITAALSPEMQALAKKDAASLTKDERIALAKAKAEAMKAAKPAASGAPAAPAKPAEPTAWEKNREAAKDLPIVKELAAKFGGAVEDFSLDAAKRPVIVVKSDALADIARHAKDVLGFDQLANLTAVDFPPERLELVLNLYSFEKKQHVELKVRLARPTTAIETVETMSVTPVWRTADWLEREVYDLYGITFAGHPDMRRLLLPEGWVGHPLRKDYDASKEQFIGVDATGDDVVSFDSTGGW